MAFLCDLCVIFANFAVKIFSCETSLTKLSEHN